MFLRQLGVNLRWILRDRLTYAVFFSGLALLLLVPAFSLFSLRQVQELAITLSLSLISFLLLVLALLLGSSSIWRDLERGYIRTVLTLPLSRSSYLLAKFCAMAVFLVATALLMGAVAGLVVYLASLLYPSDLAIPWGNLVLAVGADLIKYLFLSGFAIFLSCLGTSFYFPFFVTLAIYFVGNASQEVFEYLTGNYAPQLGSVSAGLVRFGHYLLPNFAPFNLKVQAVYGLPVSLGDLAVAAVYASVYTAVLLLAAGWLFGRRQFP